MRKTPDVRLTGPMTGIAITHTRKTRIFFEFVLAVENQHLINLKSWPRLSTAGGNQASLQRRAIRQTRSKQQHSEEMIMKGADDTLNRGNIKRGNLAAENCSNSDIEGNLKAKSAQGWDTA